MIEFDNGTRAFTILLLNRRCQLIATKQKMREFYYLTRDSSISPSTRDFIVLKPKQISQHFTAEQDMLAFEILTCEPNDMKRDGSILLNQRRQHIATKHEMLALPYPAIDSIKLLLNVRRQQFATEPDTLAFFYITRYFTFIEMRAFNYAGIQQLINDAIVLLVEKTFSSHERRVSTLQEKMLAFNYLTRDTSIFPLNKRCQYFAIIQEVLASNSLTRYTSFLTTQQEMLKGFYLTIYYTMYHSLSYTRI